MASRLYGLYIVIIIRLRQADSDLRNNSLHYTTMSIHNSITNSLLCYPLKLKCTYMCIVIYFTLYVVLIIHVYNLFIWIPASHSLSKTL